VQRKVIPGGFKDGKKVPPTAVLIYEGKEYAKLLDLMKVSGSMPRFLMRSR